MPSLRGGTDTLGRRYGSGVHAARHVTHRGDWVLVEVVGDLDLATAPALRQEVLNLLNDGERKVLIDLTPTDFLDSVGLGTLVALLKRVRVHDGDLAIVCPTARLRRLFTITDLDRVFALYDTADDAIAGRG